MRNAKSTTPATKRSIKDDKGSPASGTAEATSSKKLKQARLPFKIIAPGPSTPSATAAVEKEEKQASEIETSVASSSCEKNVPRKRKLSYEEQEEAEDNLIRKRLGSKENLTTAATAIATATKKKKILNDDDSADIVDDDVALLDDDEEDDDIKRVAKPTKHLGSAKKPIKQAALPSPNTPKQPSTETKRKTRGAGTPQSSSKSNERRGVSASASKLQIKLPVSGSKKNKRRKSMHKSTNLNAEKDCTVVVDGTEEEHSADDLILLAGELNPEKRAKVENVKEVRKNEKEDQKVVIDTIDLDSDSDSKSVEVKESKISKATKKLKSTKSDSTTSRNTKKETTSLDEEQCVVGSPTISHSSKTSTEIVDPKSRVQIAAVTPAPLTDIEADDEAEDTANIDDDNLSNHSSSFSGDSKKPVQDTTDGEMLSSSNNVKGAVDNDPSKSSQTLSTKNTNGANTASDQKKPLTPKQTKLHEQRRKAREDKERKLQDERLQKQRDKEDKELARKRERDEKEEVRRKEREERDEQKRKEREEKERQRLAEMEVKNEEKRKRNEVKEEEIRKREEERKRKEQEKENAEAKKKKAAEAFTKFFVAKKGATETGFAVAGEQVAASSQHEGSSGKENKAVTATLAFRPFQVKGDMKMAPICRKVFSDAAHSNLDTFLRTLNETEDNDAENVVCTKPLHKPQLYLDELQSGNATPVKWHRPSIDVKVNDDDVLIIEDELERAGQAIVEETHRPVEHLRAKFYKFHENRRPPFFGTWRKKTSLITARRPLAQDKKYFDYEIDSDLEWEEEEPGESLDGSDDDKEKESGDDEDYEVDNEWFVPHGHLSEEELEQQNEEEGGGVGDSGEMGDANTREAQKAKLKVLQHEFAQEMKKKTEKIKPRLIGCIWTDARGKQPELCPNIIWETLQLRAILPLIAAPLIEEPLEVEKTESESPNATNTTLERTTEKLKRIALSDCILKDLIRLVHGNGHSKVFLIKEFIAYIEANVATVKNGDARGPLKSTVREKIEEFAMWKATDAAADVDKKKKKQKKRLCWIVTAETLQRMNLETLDLNKNNWQYTLPPKFLSANVKKIEVIAEPEVENADDRVKELSPPPSEVEAKGKRKLGISKFTKVLTAAEKAAQLQKVATSKATKRKSTTPATSIASVTAVPAKGKSAVSPAPIAAKKRVPLLMSVARGAQIPTSAKNALISQFLKTNTTPSDSDNKTKTTKSTVSTATSMETEVIVLE